MSPSPRILGERNFISLRPWEPIWDVRTRPGWVQSTVLDLLRQLRTLRLMSATLPSIDTVGIPPRCQLRVIFGDLEALCNAIVSAPLLCPGLIAEGYLITRSLGMDSQPQQHARGYVWGPRRQGYAVDQVLQGMRAATMQETRPNDQQMWSDDQIWDHPLQFVIWIDSMRPSAVALQDSCHLVSEPRRSEIDP